MEFQLHLQWMFQKSRVKGRFERAKNLRSAIVK